MPSYFNLLYVWIYLFFITSPRLLRLFRRVLWHDFAWTSPLSTALESKDTSVLSIPAAGKYSPAAASCSGGLWCQRSAARRQQTPLLSCVSVRRRRAGWCVHGSRNRTCQSLQPVELHLSTRIAVWAPSSDRLNMSVSSSGRRVDTMRTCLLISLVFLSVCCSVRGEFCVGSFWLRVSSARSVWHPHSPPVSQLS